MYGVIKNRLILNKASKCASNKNKEKLDVEVIGLIVTGALIPSCDK